MTVSKLYRVTGVVIELVLIVTILVGLSWYFSKTWELTLGDAAITWIYSKNLADHGRLLEYNIGEKSTGATSLGQVVAFAIVHKLFGPGKHFINYDISVLVLYFLSLFVLYRLCKELRLGGAVAIYTVVAYVVFVPQIYYSAVAFEPPAWFFFVFLMWLTLLHLMKEPLNRCRYRTIAFFAIAACVQTSYRPEAAVFTLAALLLLIWRNRSYLLDRGFLLRFIAVGAIAVLPAVYLAIVNLFYFDSLLGTSSVARIARTQAFNADRVWLHFGRSIQLAKRPYWLLFIAIAMASVAAAFAGFVQLIRRRANKHNTTERSNELHTPAVRAVEATDRHVLLAFSVHIVALLVFYYLILSIKFKVDVADRYSIPFLVLLCFVSGISLGLLRATIARRDIARIAFAVLVLAGGMWCIHNKVYPVLLNRYKWEIPRIRRVPPSAMFEEELVQWLHENTDKDESVLMYEVQVKYILNRRMIDIDGILSGNSFPYFRSNKWNEFLCTYKPDIWVANPAIFYRQDMFIDNSLFRRVIRYFDDLKRRQDLARSTRGRRGRTRSAQGGNTKIFDGIEFTLLKRRPKPSRSDYAEYTHVFRIRYPNCPDKEDQQP